MSITCSRFELGTFWIQLYEAKITVFWDVLQYMHQPSTLKLQPVGSYETLVPMTSRRYMSPYPRRPQALYSPMWEPQTRQCWVLLQIQHWAEGDMTQTSAENGVSLKHQNTSSEWAGDCVYSSQKDALQLETLSLHSWHWEGETHSKVQNKRVQDNGRSSRFGGGGKKNSWSLLSLLHSIRWNKRCNLNLCNLVTISVNKIY